MKLSRLLFFATLLILGPLVDLVLAQRPPMRPRRSINFELEEPRTRLEEFEYRQETVLIRGSTTIAPLEGRLNSIRVQALELRDVGNSAIARGIAITLRDSATQPAIERSSLIDYEEIDALIKGFDMVAAADETITKLVMFEARYETKGGFEVRVFRQTSGGIAAAISTGTIERLAMFVSLDELAKIRVLLVEAKARLDEAK